VTLELTRPRAAPAARPSRRALSFVERLARGAVTERLTSLVGGRITIVDAESSSAFGPEAADLRATVTVHDPAMWTAVAFRGTVGAGESYVDGEWTSDDLTALVRILVRDRATMEGVERGLARFAAAPLRLFHAMRRNTRDGSRRNIASHYDLGNDFYALWLDGSLVYSCALFEREDATLAEAQFAKNEMICRKLQLHPADHLLEFGSGWGGFAVHAARRFGCRVTTTTISREQHAFATRRVAEAGLADRVRVLASDYRDLEGRYDKLVSIEMVEAVGHEYLDAFFAKAASLLSPGGLMCLQSITIEDRLYESARRSVDFIRRHVFPGSCIPSVSVLVDSAARAGGLTLSHMEDIGPHYATTLRLWRERFLARRDEVLATGRDERFMRLWEFYLRYCEGGFAERQLGDAQLVFRR
jgi:cyclopropane-fatty-acyl-phospholipid synthase